MAQPPAASVATPDAWSRTRTGYWPKPISFWKYFGTKFFDGSVVMSIGCAWALPGTVAHIHLMPAALAVSITLSAPTKLVSA